MQLYQAPLEGITGYIFRNALNEYFGGVDKYFAPFISPYEKRIITEREKNQLMPEHNTDINLVPQIMTMDATGFIELTDWLNENYGYDEFNLNFGCPSGTVVSKGRGAGSLGRLDEMEAFLDYIYSKSKYKVSIKTRVGLHNADEFEEILALYNKYPVSELIIHPRVRDELYKGCPHMELFEYAKAHTDIPLIYNGDINVNSKIVEKEDVMIGRGMLANPSIFRMLKGGPIFTKEELKGFLDKICDDYSAEFSGEVPVLHKLKEIWSYLGTYLVEDHNADPKQLKKLMKSKKISEYEIYRNNIIREL